MNILDKIIAQKKKDVAASKNKASIAELEKSSFFGSPSISFKKHLLNEHKVGIIAEFKRQSPSKGIINSTSDVVKTTNGYALAGASALSILTDKVFFGGTCDDVRSARKLNSVPILRKEFIIDEYQIVEAKSIGADVILLLANVLNAKQIKQYAQFAKSIGLEVLLEIRDKSELDTMNEFVDAVGVNNRNLKDFKVNLSQSYDLVDLIPDDFVKVSESGISDPKTVHDLRVAGFSGFLMGETFMKTNDPAAACADFINDVKKYKG